MRERAPIATKDLREDVGGEWDSIEKHQGDF